MISDDRSAKNPARFYTVRITFPDNKLGSVEWITTTPFLDKGGKTRSIGNKDSMSRGLARIGGLSSRDSAGTAVNARLFRSREAFEAGHAGGYKLLPFRFMRWDSGEVLVTNEVGEFEFLSSETFGARRTTVVPAAMSPRR